MRNLTLHLASSSPRRRELLAALGLRFTAAGVDVAENQMPAEAPEAMVRRLAELKARTADAGRDTLVLAADTAVVLEETVFGKPTDRDSALAMLAALSGRKHRVLTGVALRQGGEMTGTISVTDVWFRAIRPDEALRYWHSGEPCDKAGAYAIQGLGGVFVAAINGSYSGVVGLPVYETAGLLRAAGLDVISEPGSGDSRRLQHRRT